MQAIASSSSSQQMQRNSLSRAAPRQVAAPRSRLLAVRLQAAIKPPQGVTLPPAEPVVMPSTFGFVENAEKLNSRAAMLGFFLLLAIEGIAGKGILELAGITTGNGLGFEF